MLLRLGLQRLAEMGARHPCHAVPFVRLQQYSQKVSETNEFPSTKEEFGTNSQILQHEVLYSESVDEHLEPPIVILHGLFGSAQNWRGLGRQLGPMLGGRSNVYALDLRNHGSSFHHPLMNFESMAADVEHWMIKQGISRATVIGHSMVSHFPMADT
jgi:pimeloyl-ACP methyl ester carboxylesterase